MNFSSEVGIHSTKNMLASRIACSCQKVLIHACFRRPCKLVSPATVRLGSRLLSRGHGSRSEPMRKPNVIKTVQTHHGEVEVEVPKACFGCGIKLQDKDPDRPGYFDLTPALLEKVLQEQLDREEMGKPDKTDEVEIERNNLMNKRFEDLSDDEKLQVVDAVLDDEGKDERNVTYVVEDYDEALPLRCARCHSLVNYGKVKSTLGEAFLPEFNLGKKVGRKIALQKGRRAVVLCVVDITDFDGSLPRVALRELIPTSAASPGLACQLMFAVNKVDLMPKSCSRARLEVWVRTRAKDGGLPPLAAVHLVSSVNMMGVQNLLQDAIKRVGTRGDLWVVGAQNAGKSSLINALKQATGTSGRNDVTAAWLPGTTLDVVEVKGLPMPRKCFVYDTPGVRHDHQLSSLVNPAECQMLLPKRRLQPRTFRTASGYSILVAGLARLDILSCPTASIYLTFWAADQIQCHLGRTEYAEERLLKCAGVSLCPPETPTRFQDLGPLKPVHVEVKGSSWKKSTKDVCLAGIGWFGIGVSGVAKFCVHTLDGAQITIRDSLIPDFAADFETPGFSREVNIGVPNKKKGSRSRKKK